MVALLLFLLMDVRGCARCMDVGELRRPMFGRDRAHGGKDQRKLDAKAAAGPPAPASAMAGMSDQPTPRSMATVEERLGEISPQTVHAVEQAMASARAADGAGDKAACEQALADVQRTLGQ